MTLTLVLRFAVRDWRAGELRLLFAALLLAVGAVSAVSLFVDRLQQALVAESSSFLGADRVIDSSQAIPERFRELARAEGLRLADVVTFPSMVFASASGGRADGRSQLAGVKAVTPGYPLRGVLRVADVPFGASRATSSTPGLGEVWMDSRLFPALGVAVGDQVVVGHARFVAAAVIATEPDRGGGFAEFAPRLLMRGEDLPSTGVIQPGSRIEYRLGLAGEEDRLAALRAAIEGELAPNYRWRGIRDTSANIGGALERAESFLLLGGLLAVLLAGIAVALGANRYARRHFDHVGVLKTLGATPREILWGYTGVLLVIGVAGALLGLVLGVLVHWAIIATLGGYLPADLPWPSPRPLFVGLATGFICLLAFALPPLIGLRKVSPMRVMRRDLAPGSAPFLTYGCAVAGSLGLLIWYSGDARLTVAALFGGVVVGGCFALLALALLRGGRVVGMQAGSAWRLALAGLQRRHRENVAQIMIFGFAILLLLVMVLVRTALIDEWRAQIPEGTPNHFLMNVAPDEAVSVQALLERNTDYDGELLPTTSGRVSAVNDVPADEWRRRLRAKSEDRSGPDIRSERNLTFLARLPANNVVVEGQWWTDTPETPAVSLAEDYARALGIAVGDSISFDIGGLALATKVTNLRRVNWDIPQLNFFIIFSPGALADLPVTYMASFFLVREKKPFLNKLLAEHPTVTVMEWDAIIAQVRSIVARVTQAVELVLYLVLAAGALVLIASIQSSRDQRWKEHALLRALGGTRRLISGALVAEFTVLGVFAGVIAAAGAEITVWVLNSRIFELATRWHPWLFVAGPVLGMTIVAGVGYLGTRKLVFSPPITVLREI